MNKNQYGEDLLPEFYEVVGAERRSAIEKLAKNPGRIIVEVVTRADRNHLNASGNPIHLRPGEDVMKVLLPAK